MMIQQILREQQEGSWGINFFNTSITSFLPSSSCIVHSNITPPLYLTVCMNMKPLINRKMNSRLFNRAPINFWEPEKKVEKDSMTKTSYEDIICHEVKYNPAYKERDSYKLYIKPFSHGTAEQWLKFIDKCNIIIQGNGLDKDCPVCFNVTHSSLKGKAL
jgi:hypothetical protein